MNSLSILGSDDMRYRPAVKDTIEGAVKRRCSDGDGKMRPEYHSVACRACGHTGFGRHRKSVGTERVYAIVGLVRVFRDVLLF